MYCIHLHLSNLADALTFPDNALKENKRSTFYVWCSSELILQSVSVCPFHLIPCRSLKGLGASRRCRETTDADRDGQPNDLFEGLPLQPMAVGPDKLDIEYGFRGRSYCNPHDEWSLWELEMSKENGKGNDIFPWSLTNLLAISSGI